MRPGSVVAIYAASAGKVKYHLCLCLPSDEVAAKFLFINSNPNFKDIFIIDDARLPFLPESPSGKSCFSFSMVPRYSGQQLRTFDAKVIGEIDLALAVELRHHADGVRSLARTDLDFVKGALDVIVNELAP